MKISVVTVSNVLQDLKLVGETFTSVGKDMELLQLQRPQYLIPMSLYLERSYRHFYVLMSAMPFLEMTVIMFVY